MANLSDYAEKLLLDWLMTAGAATRPTAWHLALYTAAPNDAGGGTVVSGAGYARQPISFAAASSPGGTMASSDSQTFEAAASWGTVTHFAIFDASTGGNMLWHGALTNSRTVGSGDRLIFDAGAITLTMA